MYPRSIGRTLIAMALSRHHLVHQSISFFSRAANSRGSVSNYQSLSHYLCRAKMSWIRSTDSVRADHSNSCRPMCAGRHMNRTTCTPFRQPNAGKSNARIRLKKSNRIKICVNTVNKSDSLPNWPACGELSEMKLTTLWSAKFSRIALATRPPCE